MTRKTILKAGFYLCLFCLFLLYNLVLFPINGDEVVNYGFAHNIYQGFIPYKDFNMVIPPLFPFLMSLPFYLFGSNILVFHIEGALLLTILSYFLIQLLGKKTVIVMMFLFFFFRTINPSYNLFLLFLFVLIIYLEKKNKSDYLIGFLIGCMILTKHTVGIFFLLPSLFYLKDKKKIGKRLFTCSVPIIIFIFYLIGTKSISQFFDLCILGLFDFGNHNGNLFSIGFILFFLVFCYNLYLIKRDKKNFLYYYSLSFCSMVIPLFDFYHFGFYFIAFIMVLLIDSSKQFLNLRYFSFFFLIFLIGDTSIERIISNDIYPNSLKHFEYRYIEQKVLNRTELINSFIKKYQNKNLIILSPNSYFYKIVNDIKINEFDLLNLGNHGYQGTKKLKNKICSMKGKKETMIIIEIPKMYKGNQFNLEFVRFVIEHSKLIEKKENIYVYTLK